MTTVAYKSVKVITFNFFLEDKNFLPLLNIPCLLLLCIVCSDRGHIAFKDFFLFSKPFS